MDVGPKSIDFTLAIRIREWRSKCPILVRESPMNQRLMTILLSAFLIAAGASYLVYRLVGKQMGENLKNRATTIVFASQDLEIGAIVKASDLKAASLVGAPPKDAILKAETAVGRGVL